MLNFLFIYLFNVLFSLAQSLASAQSEGGVAAAKAISIAKSSGDDDDAESFAGAESSARSF